MKKFGVTHREKPPGSPILDVQPFNHVIAFLYTISYD